MTSCAAVECIWVADTGLIPLKPTSSLNGPPALTKNLSVNSDELGIRLSGVVPINTQHSQHGSEPEHGLVRRIFINRPPPGFLEATVDYAGLERETPHPAMSVALPAGNLGENTQRTGTTQSEAAQTTQLASKST